MTIPMPKRMDDQDARREYEQAWQDRCEKLNRQIKDRLMTKQQYYWMWSSLREATRACRALKDGTHPMFEREKIVHVRYVRRSKMDVISKFFSRVLWWLVTPFIWLGSKVCELCGVNDG